MELIRGLHNLQPRHHGCVATIGNFDGIHLGHQAVIGQLAEKADSLGLPTLVMLFEPQPLEYFQLDQAPARLSRLREKLQALRRYSVDRVLVARFNQRFAEMTAEAFIQQVLVDGLGVRYLVVGDDFRFGHARAGDFTMLQQAGEAQGFQVVNMHAVMIDGARVSSSRLRHLLQDGELEAAEGLLGRPYRMSGRVAHGDKLGRTIGIPTANIYLHRQVSPLQGIFVVEVFGLQSEPIPGAASIGTRPTVGGTETLLEIHLLDFSDDIYGQYVNINFLHKLRDEERFDSMATMQAAIEQDIVATRAYFARSAATNNESR